jgi:glycosyltransferase involved in cell wall biosynthesis
LPPAELRYSVRVTLRLSLVIPVYNEEHYIGACLEAVTRQIRLPDEVIVVDNGSTDASRSVIDGFVGRLQMTVLSESRQGAMYARDAGFDAATGEVIGRIDADTLLDPHWCERVEQYIESDPELDAIAGSQFFYELPWKRLQERQRTAALDTYMNTEPSVTDALSGNNMAIRKTAWEKAKPHLVGRADLHEDMDLSMALKKSSALLWYAPRVFADVSARRFRSSRKELLQYGRTMMDTAVAHDDQELVNALKKNKYAIGLNFAILWAIEQNYDPDKDRIVPFFLRKDKKERVSPVAIP